jgi:hypothetical protein
MNIQEGKTFVLVHIKTPTLLAGPEKYQIQT